MPNWTYNTITASKKVISKIKKELTNEEGGFDFNKLIPMPESLDVTAGSSNDKDAYYYLSDRLTIPLEEVRKNPLSELFGRRLGNDWIKEIAKRTEEAVSDEEQYRPNYDAGRQLCTNYEKYGCITWYEWCNANWGTKWNACNSSFTDESLYFETAWDAPEPILEKLCEMFPEENLQIESEFEEGFVKYFSNDNGLLLFEGEDELDWNEEEW